MKTLGVQADEQPVDQGLVHAADQFRVQPGEAVEGAVAQPEAAVLVAPRLEAVTAEHSLQDTAPVCGLDIGLAGEVGTELPGGLMPALSASTAAARRRAASSYSLGGTVTANSRPDRKYILAGRPAPGPRRPAGRW
jgi:hypothetical protein